MTSRRSLFKLNITKKSGVCDNSRENELDVQLQIHVQLRMKSTVGSIAFGSKVECED